MNITDNLIRIKEGKDNIIKSLKNKGVSISDDALISEIPTIIDNAEIGGDTPVQPETPELTPKYEGASVFRIVVPNDNYEFAINLCNSTTATYDVDWGDGSLESGLTTDEQHHTYSKAGTYDVNIYNLSNNITLGGSTSISGGSSVTVYYLFNNTNNDYWLGNTYKYQKDNTVTNILIGDKITSIGNYAFQNCSSLQSIVISESVTRIGNSAFSGCSSLQSIVIPNSVTSIGNYNFQNCSSLQSIVIPNSVTVIDNYAFENCSSLQSIVIPNSVTSIGSNAFKNCTSLQSVVIPEGVTSIGSNVFYGCYFLQSITINSETAPTIQTNSFPTSSFKYTKRYLYVPINSSAYESGNWKTYLIDKGWELRYIEDKPEKVPTTLKLKTTNNFFHNLQTIGQANLIDYELIDNEYIYNFDDKITELVQYTFYNKVLEEIELPEGLEIIGNAFENCSSLQSIVIPESVTSIGSNAFKNCTSLQSVDLPNSVTSIGSSVFEGCSSLQSIVIPEGVTSIGSSVFYKCSSLQSVDLPSGITEIKGSTFQDCTAVHTFICRAMVAPTSANATWNNLGKNVPSGTPKILYIPKGATGYDSSNTYWNEFFNKGFTIEYIN